MPRAEILHHLLELEDAHRGDKDGGYALVADLFRLLSGQDEPGRRAVREQLLERVDCRDERLWGVALEALVEEGAGETASALEGMLRSGTHDGEWREHVIAALMRMRYAPALDLYVEHIEAGVRDGSPAALSLLRHLYAFDRERALALSAGYLAEHLPEEADDLGGLVQGQLVALAELDASLAPELVRRTSAIRPDAGRALARLMSGFLDMPWLRERLGVATATALQEDLAGVAG